MERDLAGEAVAHARFLAWEKPRVKRELFFKPRDMSNLSLQRINHCWQRIQSRQRKNCEISIRNKYFLPSVCSQHVYLLHQKVIAIRVMWKVSKTPDGLQLFPLYSFGGIFWLQLSSLSPSEERNGPIKVWKSEPLVFSDVKIFCEKDSVEHGQTSEVIKTIKRKVPKSR